MLAAAAAAGGGKVTAGRAGAESPGRRHARRQGRSEEGTREERAAERERLAAAREALAAASRATRDRRAGGAARGVRGRARGTRRRESAAARQGRRGRRAKRRRRRSPQRSARPPPPDKARDAANERVKRAKAELRRDAGPGREGAPRRIRAERAPRTALGYGYGLQTRQLTRRSASVRTTAASSPISTGFGTNSWNPAVSARC